MGPLNFQTVTIPAGSATSSAVKLNHGEIILGLIMPPAWTDALIGFQSTTDGSTFYDVKGSPYGGPYGHILQPVDAGSWVVVDPILTPGLRWFRLRSLSALGAPVNQAAQRVITVVSARTLP